MRRSIHFFPWRSRFAPWRRPTKNRPREERSIVLVRTSTFRANEKAACTRVVHPDWVKPGIHITCVKDSELGGETIRKADRVVIHSRNFAPENYIAGYGDQKIVVHDPIGFLRERKELTSEAVQIPFWIAAPELKDVVAGKVSGRGSAREVTCFVNNIGLGIQFAALGGAVYREARSKGVGREVPTDWFLESVHP